MAYAFHLKIWPYSDAASCALFAISALFAGAFVPSSVAAQTGDPIKIGYSMALTGGLGTNGKSALLAQKIWEEDVNARGGLLGLHALNSFGLVMGIAVVRQELLGIAEATGNTPVGYSCNKPVRQR